MATNCSGCDKHSESMKRCGGCKTVFYCSKACQRSHWRHGNHKAICSFLKQGGPLYATSARSGTRGSSAKRPPVMTVIDNLTGSFSSRLGPQNGAGTQCRAPNPSPGELASLVRKLQGHLPLPRFFPLCNGSKRFLFVTDLREVQPEWDAGPMPLRERTILVAKIVEMELYWLRHGIRILVSRHIQIQNRP